ncbi:MAG: pantoate--beta-alanine ligase [Nitrospirae bacterium]|nr:pantoate--beta-alanine ligase [Nitrospirota bacterium]
MRVIRSLPAMQAWSVRERRAGRRIAFVPTMGALHAGHLSLVRRARSIADRVVVSIFVNPLQFGPKEDFRRYPRVPLKDMTLLRPLGVDVVFLPAARAIYPDGFQTHVEVEQVSRGLCGASRPGHFRGVATVVAKLFNLVQPDAAIFGRKDFQQVKVIERMVRDLGFPVRIVEAATVRDRDGVALSSRNAYLTPDERVRARAIPQALREARAVSRRKGASPARVRALVRRRLAEAGLKVEYVETRSARTLEPVHRRERGVALLVAAGAGGTRLIDNTVLD